MSFNSRFSVKLNMALEIPLVVHVISRNALVLYCTTLLKYTEDLPRCHPQSVLIQYRCGSGNPNIQRFMLIFDLATAFRSNPIQYNNLVASASEFPNAE